MTTNYMRIVQYRLRHIILLYSNIIVHYVCVAALSEYRLRKGEKARVYTDNVFIYLKNL